MLDESLSPPDVLIVQNLFSRYTNTAQKPKPTNNSVNYYYTPSNLAALSSLDDDIEIRIIKLLSLDKSRRSILATPLYILRKTGKVAAILRNRTSLLDNQQIIILLPTPPMNNGVVMKQKKSQRAVRKGYSHHCRRKSRTHTNS